MRGRGSSSLVVLIALAGRGCDGEILRVGEDEAVTSSDNLPYPCPLSSDTSTVFADEAGMSTAVRGIWIRCRGVGGGALFPPGIEFTDTSRWYSLIADGAGRLVRSKEDARLGLYAIVPPDGVMLSSDNRAEQQLVVRFDSEARRMSVIRSTFESVAVAYVHR